MAQEPKEWTIATRRSNGRSGGGMHLYVNSEVLYCALEQAEMPLRAKLEVRAYPMKHRKGMAGVMIKIKEMKNE